MTTRPSVLVFAGLDPSGGAGISADIQAITAMGAHALPVITALTVQDNDRVFAVNPTDAPILQHQAEVLISKIPISAIKIGIVASRANAQVIAKIIRQLREAQPDMPVVLDTVLASGNGYALSEDDPAQSIQLLAPLATVIAPNLPEAARLCPQAQNIEAQAQDLLQQGAENVLIKGGHSNDPETIENRWFSANRTHTWAFPRLAGAFHGTGCTLASAIAGQLAIGTPMHSALDTAQHYVSDTLEKAYAIASGQKMPQRQVSYDVTKQT